MKKYVPIVIGVVAIAALLLIINKESEEKEVITKEEMQIVAGTQMIQGEVKRFFEGDRILSYSMTIPETATTSIERDGSLVKINDENNTLLAAAYFSYEGGRGFSPSEYINEVIVKNVKAVTSKGVVTLGGNDWEVVESEWSVWHIAKSANPEWLIVVENRKEMSDQVKTILESIITK